MENLFRVPSLNFQRKTLNYFMAEITAASVGKLREMTGAGLMDCKKALVEANGELEAAMDYLRKKGIASAEKRRVAPPTKALSPSISSRARKSA